MEGPLLPPEACTPAQVWNLIKCEFFLNRALTLRALEDRRKQQRAGLREEHFRKNPHARWYFDPHAHAKLEIRLIEEQCNASFDICRTIWKDQKRSEGDVFFDAVRDFCLFPLMDKGASDFADELDSLDKQTDEPGLHSSSRALFERELKQIRSEWSIRLKLAAIKRKRNPPPGLADAIRDGGFFASVENAEPTPSPPKQKRTPPAKPPCVAQAVKIIARNTGITPKEFCKIIDGKAQSHPREEKYKPPTKWKVNTFFDQYRKRPNTISRFLHTARNVALQSNRQT